jgi:FixJ family two-component response regulator
VELDAALAAASDTRKPANADKQPRAQAATENPKGVVTRGERAEAAVRANPGKSDRMIAEEIGVNNTTVSRARKRTVCICNS